MKKKRNLTSNTCFEGASKQNESLGEGSANWWVEQSFELLYTFSHFTPHTFSNCDGEGESFFTHENLVLRSEIEQRVTY